MSSNCINPGHKLLTGIDKKRSSAMQKKNPPAAMKVSTILKSNLLHMEHINGLMSMASFLKIWNLLNPAAQKLMRSSFEGCCFFGSCAPSDVPPLFLPKIISSRSSIMSSLLPPWIPPLEPAGFLIKASSLA